MVVILQRLTKTVALRKESVDRNLPFGRLSMLISLSLSARRAWIEIDTGTYHPHFHVVALRKESVDRNGLWPQMYPLKFGSLSARRAWIEIHTILGGYYNVAVALRKESVDRNVKSMFVRCSLMGRSPQGERG